MKLLLVSTLIAATGTLYSFPEIEDPPLPPGQHGVAYRATKDVLFGLRDATVVGRSADVTASLSWLEGGDNLRIQAAVGVRSFDSGNGRRDRHVAEILGAPEHPQISFTTEWMDVDAFREGIARGTLRLLGELEVGGRRVPVDFELRFVTDAGRASVEGTLMTTFSALDVDVPQVGPGGMIAAPHDELELFVRLHLDRVPGAAPLLEEAGRALSVR